MQATTIKLDGSLVKRLSRLKQPGETLTGLVRSILDAEIRRQQLRAAAEAYVRFLAAHPDEATAMDAWARAPLDRPAKAGKRR